MNHVNNLINQLHSLFGVKRTHDSSAAASFLLKTGNMTVGHTHDLCQHPGRYYEARLLVIRVSSGVTLWKTSTTEVRLNLSSAAMATAAQHCSEQLTRCLYKPRPLPTTQSHRSNLFDMI